MHVLSYGSTTRENVGVFFEIVSAFLSCGLDANGMTLSNSAPVPHASVRIMESPSVSK